MTASESAISNQQSAIPRWELVLGAALVALAAWLRFPGLEERGLCIPDEGAIASHGLLWLARAPGMIWAHPAHAPLLGLASSILGADVTGFLRVQAALGVFGAALIAWLFRRWEGAGAAALGALVWATAPYYLFYQRACLSDGNANLMTWIGLGLLGTALRFGRGRAEVGPGGADAPSRGLLLGAGLFLGMGFWFAPSDALPAPLACAATAAIGLRSGRAWHGVARDVGLVIAGGALSLLVTAVLGYPGISWELELRFLRASVALASKVSWTFGAFGFLWRGLGPAPCLLACVGLVVAARRRRDADLLFALVLVGLLLFTLRAGILYSRMVFPASLGVLWFAGVGAEAGVKWARGLAGVRGPACAALLVVAFGAAHAATVWGAASTARNLRGGYTETSDWLRHAGAGRLLTSQANFIFTATGAWSAVTAREELQAIWASGGGDREVGARLERFVAEGAAEGAAETGPEGARKCTHLIVDYIFWTEATPDVLRGLRSFLDRHPPDLLVENPAGANPMVLEESADWQAVGDPRAAKLWVYDLTRLCAELAR
ncbi:MAG: hypothetical protein HYZ53_13800 [Planctomycetes bacterium]|nr:hypothetical protein [Planctomycetota bacterium]